MLAPRRRVPSDVSSPAASPQRREPAVSCRSGGAAASLIRVSPSGHPSGRARGAAELEVILAQQPSAGDAPRVGRIAVEEGDDAVDEGLDRRPGAGIYAGVQVAEIGSEPGLPPPRLGGLGRT